MNISEERIMLRGRLAEADKKRVDLEIRIRALKGSMRAGLDPYDPPNEAKALEVADGAKLLLEATAQWSQVTALIESLKKDLGE